MKRRLLPILMAFFLFCFCTPFVLAQQTDSLEQVSVSELKPDAHTMIALAFGQSNAGNRGQTRYTCRNNVLVFNEGKLYKAKDPLPGSTGPGGSVWSVLGDMLIDSGLFQKVILVPAAIGNTSIDCWTEGECWTKVLRTLRMLDSAKVRLTHIFWDQGESDNLKNTPKEVYKKHLALLLKTVRDFRQTAPFYVCIASYHNQALAKPLGVDSVIRAAQKEFIKENKGVLLGPDTDSLIHAIHRWDGVHFSEYGMKQFALQWVKSLREAKE